MTGLTGRCPALEFNVNGTRVFTNRSTSFRKGKCDDLESGTDVSVEGVSDGKVVRASLVEFDKKKDKDIKGEPGRVTRAQSSVWNATRNAMNTAMAKTVGRHRGAALLLVLAVAGAPAADAQTVSDALAFLVTNPGVLTGSVERDRDAALATTATLSRSLLANLATLPVPTSSSGFLYRVNPALGTVERATDSFGPFFVERGLTTGRGQFSFGVTFQHLHFTAIDGLPLRVGSLVTTANQFVDENQPFDVDRLTLGIDASVTTFSGNFGVGDRAEISFAAPVVSLVLDGSRLNTYRNVGYTQAAAHAQTVGLADVLLRSKVMVFDRRGTSLAGAVDLRLPTGSSDDLLGAGSAAVKLMAIASIEGRRVSGHTNGGLTIGGLAKEFSYAAAVGLAASESVTIVGEVLGRWLSDGPGRIVVLSAPHPALRDVRTLRLSADGAKTNLVAVVPGLKWNVSRTWVLGGNVTIPVTAAGLTVPLTPFVGLEYALGR